MIESGSSHCLFALPDELYYSVLTQWVEIETLVSFDSALCNRKLRSRLFALFEYHGGAVLDNEDVPFGGIGHCGEEEVMNRCQRLKKAWEELYFNESRRTAMADWLRQRRLRFSFAYFTHNICVEEVAAIKDVFCIKHLSLQNLESSEQIEASFSNIDSDETIEESTNLYLSLALPIFNMLAADGNYSNLDQDKTAGTTTVSSHALQSLRKLSIFTSHIPGAFRSERTLDSVLRRLPNLTELSLWSSELHENAISIMQWRIPHLTSLFLSDLSLSSLLSLFLEHHLVNLRSFGTIRLLNVLPFTYPELEKLVQVHKEQRMLPHFTIFKDVSDPSFIGLLSPLTPRITRSALCVTDKEYQKCIVPDVVLDYCFKTNGTWSEFSIERYYEESRRLMSRFADRIGGFAEGLQNSLRTLYLQDDLHAPLSLGGARPVKKRLQQVAHPYQNMRILDKIFRDAASSTSLSTSTSSTSVCALQTLSLFILLEPSIIQQRLVDAHQVQEQQKQYTAAAAAAAYTAAFPTSPTEAARSSLLTVWSRVMSAAPQVFHGLRSLHLYFTTCHVQMDSDWLAWFAIPRCCPLLQSVMLGIETIATVDERVADVAHDARRLSRWFLHSPWASSLVHETSVGGSGGDGGGTIPMKFSAMGVLEDLAHRYPLDFHLWQDPAVVGANHRRLDECSDEPYISFVGYLLCLCAHLRAVQLRNIPSFSWGELLHLVRHDRIPCVASSSSSSAAHRPRPNGTAGRLQRLHLQYDDPALTAAMLTVPPSTTATTAASSLTTDDLLQALCTDWTAHFPSCLAAIPSLRHIQVTAHPVFQCEQSVAVEETTTTDNDNDNDGNRDAAPSSVLAPLISRIAAVHRHEFAVSELDRQMFGERTILLGPLYPKIDSPKREVVDTLDVR